MVKTDKKEGLNMAGVALRPGAIEYFEICSLTIHDSDWEVVTKKEGKRFRFKGQPIFAENTKKADDLVVDVRRGIVFIPQFKPIPHKVYDPGENAEYKGREVIETL